MTVLEALLIAVATVLLAGLVLLLSTRFGLRAVIVSCLLAMVGMSGAVSRYGDAGELLLQVGVVGLIALGVLGLFELKAPPLVTVSTFTYLGSATLAGLAMVGVSVDFALRGWIGLVAPVLAASAIAAAVRPRSNLLAPGRDLVLGTVAVVAAANGAVAMRQALYGLSPREVLGAESADATYLVGQQIRLMGVFLTNQDFALFVACLAPAFLALSLTAGRFRRTWGSLALLTYLAVALSLTRTALVASLVTGLIVVVVLGRRGSTGRLLRFAVATLASLALALVIMRSLAPQRFEDAVDRALTLLELSEDTSFLVRTSEVLPHALEIFWARPFGSGAGTAGPLSQAFPESVPYGALVTDNGYLMIAIQIGIVGLIACIAMLVSTGLWMKRSGDPFAAAGAVAILALMIAMVSAQYWGLLAPVSLVGAVVGVGVGAMQAPRQRAESRSALVSETPRARARRVRS